MTFWVYNDGFNREKYPIVMFMGHIGVPTEKLVKVLNGPPVSVKKEREAEQLLSRRDQRRGEVICIDD